VVRLGDLADDAGAHGLADRLGVGVALGVLRTRFARF